MPKFTVYCDELSDELLAREWLSEGSLASAEIRRLPALSLAPSTLRPLLAWERLDWIICRDDQVACAVEFSRHGYTGDNSFQRFARIYRSVTLGIPVVYFTPYARARLNELDEGRNSPRNVAPELFSTMQRLSETLEVPCIGVNWPTTNGGTPAPLTSPLAGAARDELVSLVEFFASNSDIGSNDAIADRFASTVTAMKAQASLPYRGSETRGQVSLPIAIDRTQWILDWLPHDYFRRGKADKILASAALHLVDPRTFSPKPSGKTFWQSTASAWALFLGYQWRPDPACGLIAFAAANAIAEQVPLIVVWPRVFSKTGPAQQAAVDALAEFKRKGTGMLAQEGARLGFSQASLSQFRERVSGDPNQFGIYTADSKIDRVLHDTADAFVLGDVVRVVK